MEWLSQNWIWLAFGAGMLLMMRRGGAGGCCGMHGHDGGERKESERTHDAAASAEQPHETAPRT